MNRRKFLAAAAATLHQRSSRLPLIHERRQRCPIMAVVPASPGWRRFEITTRVCLPETAEAAQLWLPLAKTTGGYQNVLDLVCRATARPGASTTPATELRSCTPFGATA